MDPLQILLTADWRPTILLLILIGIVRGCVVRRTGHSFWLGFVWALPIIGWIFKVWLAHADWPGRRSTGAKAKTTKKKATRKRAAA